MLASVLIGGVAAAWLFGLGTPTVTSQPEPFNSERWKAADHWSETRCRMVADLRFRVGLVGKTEREVVQLIGEDIDGNRPPKLYLLCPSLADNFALELEWKDGRVVSSWIRDT